MDSLSLEFRRPLDGVRIVDQTGLHANGCAAFFAELGADVILVQRSDRRHDLASASTGTFDARFETRNANKRTVAVDLDTGDGRRALLSMLDAADIWITDDPSLDDDRSELALTAVAVRCPTLVIASITAFGRTGPRASWRSMPLIAMALGGQLARSGVPNREPLPPPDDIGLVAGDMQCAWMIVMAYWNRLRSGRGDVLDISLHEAVALGLDPTFGSIGTAAAQAGTAAPSGRSPSFLYPTFRCADGHVRFAILSARQWRALRAWLGEPPAFCDDSFDEARRRYEQASELYTLIADLVGSLPMDTIVTEGQSRGVPVAPVLSTDEVARVEHFNVRGLWADIDVLGRTGRIPSGHVILDGHRAGLRPPASLPAGHAGFRPRAVLSEASVDDAGSGTRPLDGVRVLDLGVIVMGGEAGKLLADQGAHVIKIESRRHPDGARIGGMTPRFASSQRNKQSMGIDLRAPEGRELFEELVRRSDVVLTNFKPGTLASLGLAADHLRSLNPGLIVVTSSAMGETGPWRDWMGYGPLVRCVAGLADRWRYGDGAREFGDNTTIYPDHLVARIVATTVVAALVRRRTDGLGAHIESSQAETVVIAQAARFLERSIDPPADVPEIPTRSLHGVYQCAGHDQWCAIAVDTDDEWRSLVGLIAGSGSLADAALASPADGRRADETVRSFIESWARTRSRDDVAETLQASGICAAPVQNAHDQLSDPQLQARTFFREVIQPGVPEPVVTDRGSCAARHLPDPPHRAAPYHGQHTRSIARDVLGLPDHAIDDLISRGVLESLSAADAEILAATSTDVSAMSHATVTPWR